MTPKEYVDWFYEKFKDGLKEYFSEGIIARERLDQETIIKLIEDYKCESVLEIGTWEGQTGLLIWLHPKVKKFRAIDIDKTMCDDYYSAFHRTFAVDKEFIGHYLKDTNTNIDFVNTMKWNVEEWQREAGYFDMIFIDGNHDYEHVKNDTLKSMKLKPKIIVWHDVNHINGTDQVPTFLAELKLQNYNIQYVNDTEIGYLAL